MFRSFAIFNMHVAHTLYGILFWALHAARQSTCIPNLVNIKRIRWFYYKLFVDIKVRSSPQDRMLWCILYILGTVKFWEWFATFTSLYHTKRFSHLPLTERYIAVPLPVLSYTYFNRVGNAWVSWQDGKIQDFIENTVFYLLLELKWN